MDEKSRLDLSKYRFERAEGAIKTAQNILDFGDPNGSASRSYYAIFYAMWSISALDGFESSKHSSLISYFGRTYIKTKIFDTSLSDIVRFAFRTRTHADYADFYQLPAEKAQMQIYDAQKFIETIRPYLQSRWVEMEEKINERNI